MHRFAVEKLVRDKRLQAMQDKGLRVRYEILSDEAYAKALRKKLVEEAEEVLEARSDAELKSEIADVAEVLEHLMSAHGIGWEEIGALRDAKRAEAGNFTRRIFVRRVEMDDDSEHADYYLASPRKYQKI